MAGEQTLALESTQDIEEFRAKLEKADALPSIPTALIELLDVLKQDDSTNEDLARIISRDAGLVARTLKLANSAAMGLRSQITSIQQAIGLLGRTQIRQVCLGGGVWDALKPYAEKANFDLHAFEKHCQTTAEIANTLARRTDAVEAEDVFSAALLHDMGKFLLLAYDGEAYSQALNRARSENGNLEEIEYETMGWTHSVVGGWLTDHWGLPKPVRETVKWHHHSLDHMESENGKLVALIAVSNNMCKVVKMGDSGNPSVEAIGKLLSPVGLEPNDIKEVGEIVKTWEGQSV